MFTGLELPRFRKKLLTWFAQFQRDLPWRRTKDAYRIWLSEIMLQQTRVAAAIPYYERFLQRFPDVNALAEAPEEEILRYWAGLGYYSRARNLQKAAKQIVDQHQSIFPNTSETALTLAGIGPYTAPAILSIAYGKQLAVLDGNVARVIARLEAVRGELRSASRWQALQRTADSLLAPSAPGDWNQAMMELGAVICTPKSPQCLLCPVTDFCRARKLGLVNSIPEKRSKRPSVEITLAALVLLDRNGHTLLLPPPKSGDKTAPHSDVSVLLSKMWHFPTIQAKKNPANELRAFVTTILPREHLAANLQALAKVRHTVTYRQITLLPFRLNVASLPRIPHAKVLPLDDLSRVPISNLTRKVARAATQSSKHPQEPVARHTALAY
jgi:A/G-specific adenine glycosylase